MATTTTTLPPGEPCTDAEWSNALNVGWVLITAGMVFALYLGLSMMESGSVRRKNSRVVFLRYAVCTFAAVIMFWSIGFAFAFGDSFDDFMGGSNYYFNREWSFCNPTTNTVEQYSFWCLMLFSMLVSLWVTLSMLSERITLKASFIYTIFHSFWIWPIVAAWTWGRGWVNDIGYYDYAGAGQVFMVGAFAGLAGLLIIGTRYNRWNKYEDVYDERMMEVEMKGMRSIPVERLGDEGPYYPRVQVSKEVSRQVTFINMSRLRQRAFDEENDNFGIGNLYLFLIGFFLTWIGLYYYSIGHSWGLFKALTGIYRNSARSGPNLMLGAAAGGILSWMLRTPLMYGPRAPRRLRFESIAVVRGALAGMIACLPGLNVYYPWACLCIGAVGSFFYLITTKIFEALKIDDPVEGFATFGMSAVVGVICLAFFFPVEGIFYSNPSSGLIFAWQLLGNGVIPAWGFVCGFIVFLVLKLLRMLRVDLRTEVIGYDYVEYADEIDFTGKKLLVRKVEPAVGKKA